MIDKQFLAASPEEVGIDSGRLEQLFVRVKSDVDEGRLPAAEVAVGRNGNVAGAAMFGAAPQGGELKPITPETLFCFYSASKAVMASSVWALLEEGKLALDEVVAEIIPEFGGRGKDDITVLQLLTFTSGFPNAPMHPRLWGDREARLERITGWRLWWEPDTRYEYHHTSAHWVLAEIVTHRTGLDFRDYFRQRIAEPMGLPELYLGLPDEQHHRAAEICYTEPPIEPEGGWGEVSPNTTLHFNLPSQRRAGCPAAGLFSTAPELAAFYQVLVNRGKALDGTQVLKPETVELATRVHTRDHHRETAHDITANRGLSIVIAGDDGNAVLRGFGSGTSPRAFGHGGGGGQVAWGDPETGLSFSYCTNGLQPAEAITQRVRDVSTLAAACVI